MIFLRHRLVLLLCGVFLATAAAAFSAEGDDVPAEVAEKQPAGEVQLGGRDLFPVQAQILSFTPQERGRLISERLTLLARRTGDAAQLLIVEGRLSDDIVADGQVLMSVTDADARLAGVPRRTLAEERLIRLRTALEDYHRVRTPQALMQSVIYALLDTAALIALILLLNALTRRLLGKIDKERGQRIHALHFQQSVIVTEEQVARATGFLVRLIRVGILIVSVEIYLTSILHLFPWTQPFAYRLTGYLTRPLVRAALAFIDYLPRLIVLLLILGGFYLINRAFRFFFDELGRKTIRLDGFLPEWADPTYKIVRFLLMAMTAVVAFPYIPGADSLAFKGVSVFLGLLLSLGSSSAVANIVSGLILTYTRAFNIGDRVRVGEATGDVIEKTLIVTRIRTIKNVDITVPNSMILGSHVFNYSAAARDRGLILHTGVTIGYDAPWRQVHQLLIAAAQRTAGILAEPAPFVLQTALDDFYVSYEINAYTDQAGRMAAIYSELHANIQDAFNAAGVEIMSPHYSCLRDGNTVTLSSDALPAGYVAGGLRVETIAGESRG